MIDSRKARDFLQSLEGSRLQGGNSQNTFTEFFEVEEVTKVEEVDLENPDDDKLQGLVDGIND